MESYLMKKLGIVKQKIINKEFDKIYDLYSIKAKTLGYTGDIKFIKEHGKVIIYVTIES